MPAYPGADGPAVRGTAGSQPRAGQAWTGEAWDGRDGAAGQRGAGTDQQGGALAIPGAPPAPPAVTLPKGGGAIRDIGEKFSVSAATGTASLAVPVATSPGRVGLGPALSLAYDSAVDAARPSEGHC